MSITKKIALSALIPNPKNPRIQGVKNSREAVGEILKCEGIEVLNLARNIIDKGWLERQKIVVTKNADEPGYIVHDGNRRVIALQLLLGQIRSVPSELKKTLTKLKEQAKNLPTKVECIICDEIEADLMVEEAHSAEEGGRGQKQWTAMMRSRHAYSRESAGKCKSSAVPYRTAYRFVAAYLENLNIDDDMRREIARDFEISTLDRLIPQWKVITKLDDEELVEQHAPCSAQDPASKIITSIYLGDTKAKTIWTDVDQIQFLRQNGADKAPDGTRVASNGTASKNSGKGASKGTSKRSDPLSGTIGHVKDLLRSLDANGDHNAKLRSIRSEMVKCNIKDCRITFCLLTRCMVEVAVRAYAERHGIKEYKEGGNKLHFGQFIQGVTDHAAVTADRSVAERLRAAKAKFMDTGPMGWDWLCDMSHKHDRTPSVDDICVYFETIFPLVIKLASS